MCMTHPYIESKLPQPQPSWKIRSFLFDGSKQNGTVSITGKPIKRL